MNKYNKHPGGRPTKYKKSICDDLPEMFKDGQSIVEVCVELGINVDTFAEWRKKYPEFSAASKRGFLLSQAWWEKLGRALSTGKIKANPVSWIFNMKNRFKYNLSTEHLETQYETRWADKFETDNQHKLEGDINQTQRYVFEIPPEKKEEDWTKDAEEAEKCSQQKMQEFLDKTTASTIETST